MSLVIDYPSKKSLRESVGTALKFQDHSIHQSDYVSTGVVYACNRPHITGHKREFHAQIILKNNVIIKVK